MTLAAKIATDVLADLTRGGFDLARKYDVQAGDGADGAVALYAYDRREGGGAFDPFADDAFPAARLTLRYTPDLSLTTDYTRLVESLSMQAAHDARAAGL